MKRILEIVPARPGWYARWRYASAATRCYPLILWVLLAEADGSGRKVIGLDRIGQWPGSDGNGTGATFVRYLFQPPEAGDPGDAVPGPIGPAGPHALRRSAHCDPRVGGGRIQITNIFPNTAPLSPPLARMQVKRFPLPGGQEHGVLRR